MVYLGRDPFIGRRVALKSTATRPPTDPEELKLFRYRFFNEAQAAGKLSHPNIVSVFDACVEQYRCYIVLEYVNGPTLAGFCRPDNLLPVEAVVNTIYQAAKALDYAHRKGVIHRDIKPSNIMLTRKAVAKITDFGIAAVEGAHLPSGQLPDSASAYYSSPEQLRRKILNHQTDIFSLGVVMYELLTGVKPFEAETDVALFFKVTSEDPAPMKTHRPDLPAPLDRIVRKAMHRDLGERYKAGRQMAYELSAYFDHLRYLEDEIEMEEKFHAIKKINFFKEFTSVELSEVVDVTQWVDYQDGASIISEGAIEDCFYIIVAGGVRVSKRGQTIAELQAGDCFGEMAYLAKTVRTADVSAVGPTSLMRVNPTVINQTSKGTQLQFYKVFAETLIERLIKTNEMLFNPDFRNSG